jgi:hypothetical protein
MCSFCERIKATEGEYCWYCVDPDNRAPLSLYEEDEMWAEWYLGMTDTRPDDLPTE